MQNTNIIQNAETNWRMYGIINSVRPNSNGNPIIL